MAQALWTCSVAEAPWGVSRLLLGAHSGPAPAQKPGSSASREAWRGSGGLQTPCRSFGLCPPAPSLRSQHVLGPALGHPDISRSKKPAADRLLPSLPEHCLDREELSTGPGHRDAGIWPQPGCGALAKPLWDLREHGAHLLPSAPTRPPLHPCLSQCTGSGPEASWHGPFFLPTPWGQPYGLLPPPQPPGTHGSGNSLETPKPSEDRMHQTPNCRTPSPQNLKPTGWARLHCRSHTGPPSSAWPLAPRPSMMSL